MPRSLKKGPFVHDSLIKKIKKLNEAQEKKVIKTWSNQTSIANSEGKEEDERQSDKVN